MFSLCINVLFLERELKKALRDTLTRAANQIARLTEILVKYMSNIRDKRGDVNSEALKWNMELS